MSRSYPWKTDHFHHCHCIIPVSGPGLYCCICEDDLCQTGRLLKVAGNMTAEGLIELIEFKKNKETYESKLGVDFTKETELLNTQ